MIPKTTLLEFNKLIERMPMETVEHLRRTLENDHDILTHQYYEFDKVKERFCLLAIMAGINTTKFIKKTDEEKVRAAHDFANEVRGEDPIFLEVYLQDRAALNRKLLTREEILQIVEICNRKLKFNKTMSA